MNLTLTLFDASTGAFDASIAREGVAYLETRFDKPSPASWSWQPHTKAVSNNRLPSFDAPDFLTTRRRSCVGHFIVNHVVSSCVVINQVS